MGRARGEQISSAVPMAWALGGSRQTVQSCGRRPCSGRWRALPARQPRSERRRNAHLSYGAPEGGGERGGGGCECYLQVQKGQQVVCVHLIHDWLGGISREEKVGVKRVDLFGTITVLACTSSIAINIITSNCSSGCGWVGVLWCECVHCLVAVYDTAPYQQPMPAQ